MIDYKITSVKTIDNLEDNGKLEKKSKFIVGKNNQSTAYTTTYDTLSGQIAADLQINEYCKTNELQSYYAKDDIDSQLNNINNNINNELNARDKQIEEIKNNIQNLDTKQLPKATDNEYGTIRLLNNSEYNSIINNKNSLDIKNTNITIISRILKNSDNGYYTESQDIKSLFTQIGNNINATNSKIDEINAKVDTFETLNIDINQIVDSKNNLSSINKLLQDSLVNLYGSQYRQYIYRLDYNKSRIANVLNNTLENEINRIGQNIVRILSTEFSNTEIEKLSYVTIPIEVKLNEVTNELDYHLSVKWYFDPTDIDIVKITQEVENIRYNFSSNDIDILQLSAYDFQKKTTKKLTEILKVGDILEINCQDVNINSNTKKLTFSDTNIQYITHTFVNNEELVDGVIYDLYQLSTNVSTKIDTLSTEIDYLSTALSTEIDNLSTDLFDEIDDLSTTLSTKIDTLSAKLSTEIDDLSTDLFSEIDDLTTDLFGEVNKLSNFVEYATASTSSDISDSEENDKILPTCYAIKQYIQAYLNELIK